MLIDVIKSEILFNSNAVVSILKYEVEKGYKDLFDNRHHYYDIRVSWNDERDSFEDVYDVIYTKREALKLFSEAKKYALNVIEEDKQRRIKHQERLKPVSVLDTVTGHTFNFKNHYDKDEFFNAWDRLVVSSEEV